MIGEKKQQPTFVDDVLKLRIPQDHLLVKIKREINFGFMEEEVKDMYCSDNGLPSNFSFLPELFLIFYFA